MIYVPTYDNQYNIYTNQGYLLLMENSKLEIEYFKNIIEKIYNKDEKN